MGGDTGEATVQGSKDRENKFISRNVWRKRKGIHSKEEIDWYTILIDTQYYTVVEELSHQIRKYS